MKFQLKVDRKKSKEDWIKQKKSAAVNEFECVFLFFFHMLIKFQAKKQFCFCLRVTMFGFCLCFLCCAQHDRAASNFCFCDNVVGKNARKLLMIFLNDEFNFVSFFF